MFRINKQSNSITRLESKSFTELDFKERQHLQEWIAHQPDALGEELLIIQKEFNGFSGTNERLDLLALDKSGNLVVIENKLDDSGKNVVWQALKYVSYCANLTKPQIIEIFRLYLESDADKAEEEIREFLGAGDIDEVKINLSNSQRIMLVSARFPREVTNTALWLLGNGISVQCFRTTPYQLGQDLLLQIEQIIPPPEAKAYMIETLKKDSDDNATSEKIRQRQQERMDFWEKALGEFEKSACKLFNNISPSKDHWLSAGSGVAGCPFTLIFLLKEIRIELHLANSIQEKNKSLYDDLLKEKITIESTFKDELIWKRLDDKKMSMIQYSQSFEGDNKDNWPEMIQWFVTKMTLFEKSLRKPLAEAAQNYKASV
ncbi:MAG: DUF4268 domain-containing protein [Bacteroidetes bacterium]|nr:DUF4268 domain-containing protein [Bacteroidota bacterium]